MIGKITEESMRLIADEIIDEVAEIRTLVEKIQEQ
jgi:hypothetical protein